MLYLFSGPSHEGDVHGWLQRLATERGFQLSMAEFDAARDPPTDLSVPGFWDPLFSEIKAGSWDILLLSPPGSTFSRARNRHDGRNGPRPVRDHTFPWGFPWLRNADRDRVSEANFFIKQCLQAAKLQDQAGQCWLLVHPEDLGLTSSGLRPASIWQLPDVRSLVSERGFTFALHLCHFGAAAPTSTRVAGRLPAWNHFGVQWPVFDSGGKYLGPLQPCYLHAHTASVGWDGSAWRTASSFPSAFCELLARAVISVLPCELATDSPAPLLPAAEAFAQELLRKPIVVAKDVETLFHLLPHEPPHAGAQADSGSAFFTGACSHGGIQGLRSNTSLFPEATKVLCRFLRQAQDGFAFTSCALFNNVATKPHRDARNSSSLNLIVPVSSFEHGDIWCEDPSGTVPFTFDGVTRLGRCLQVAAGPVLLDARDRVHATMPWTGNRLVLIAYSVAQWQALSLHQKQFLLSLEFPLPDVQLQVSGLASRGGKEAAKLDAASSVKPSLEVAVPTKPSSVVASAASAVKPSLEVAVPANVIASAVKPSLEVAVPTKPSSVVASAASAVKPSLEVAVPTKPTSVIASAVKPSLEVAVPAKPSHEVASAVKPSPEVAVPTRLLTPGSKPASGSESVRVGTPQEGPTPGAPVLSVAPALPVSHEPLGLPGFLPSEQVEVLSSGEEPVSGKNVTPVPERPGESESFDPMTSRCFGPPLVCRHDPAKAPFNDGFGLCSPTRWRPQARNRTASVKELEHCENIRAILQQVVRDVIPDVRRMSFKLASGQVKESPFSAEVLQSARSKIAYLLPDAQQAMCCPERQPFYLFLLAQSLEIMGDPDFEILVQGKESFAEGIPLGWDKPLPRTPQVFCPRVRHRKLDETPFEAVMQNYESAELSSEQLEARFRADEARGLMICTTEAEAKRQFGESSVLVAAMGAIKKPNGDIRPLHDGTHGIGLNNKIRILDALHVPGPNEITEATAIAAENQEAVFALSADISEAHRRVKVRKADWPRLGCKSSSTSRVLWLNTVCTFGISSSAYWWTRLFGCVGRWVLRMMGIAWAMQLVYVDDLHMVQAGEDKFLNLWLALLAYEVIGAPFSYAKFKGGITVDFIGYHIAYKGWAAGISDRRAGWIIGWIDDCEAGGWMIAGRRLTELTGRLNFVARLLLWMRPFLAPLYAFQAVLNRGTVARAPAMVCIALTFLRSELKKGSRLESVLQAWPDPRQAFRTDAKCETGRVVIAGWSLQKGTCTKDSDWFALEILPAQAPWLFKSDGTSQWASTSAELLASYAALQVFGHLNFEDRRDHLRLVVNAGTDNRSTPSIQQKGLSNKWPVQAVHMQMVSRLHSCHKICRLQWRPREENVEADDLTNFRFEKFTAANRLHLEFSELDFSLLDMLVMARDSFEAERNKLAASFTKGEKASKRQKTEEKTSW